MYAFAILGAAGACYFAYQAFQQLRPAMFAAAIMWLLYAIYEIWITQDAVCGPNCNIRVDLLVVWPLLAIATLMASSASWTIAGKRILVVIAVIVGFLAVPALGFFLYGAFFDKPADQPATPTQQSSPQ